MRINLRQEIAMWVLGLLWVGYGAVWLLDVLQETNHTRSTIAVLTDLASQGIREQAQLAVTNAQLNMLHEQMLLYFISEVLLVVPIGLIIFSLRDRKKPN